MSYRYRWKTLTPNPILFICRDFHYYPVFSFSVHVCIHTNTMLFVLKNFIEMAAYLSKYCFSWISQTLMFYIFMRLWPERFLEGFLIFKCVKVSSYHFKIACSLNTGFHLWCLISLCMTAVIWKFFEVYILKTGLQEGIYFASLGTEGTPQHPHLLIP